MVSSASQILLLLSATTAILTLPTVALAIDNASGGANGVGGGTHRLLENIVVVGGTHGNEYTGVWCIKALDRMADTIKAQHPSLNVSTLLASPQGHLENKRFVDNDLNRQFSRDALFDESSSSIESIRARELDQILGPKFSTTNEPSNPLTDVIIDLHTTTSNMGASIIVAEGDPIMTAAAAYVINKCAAVNSLTVRCILHTHPSRESRPNLSSIARHGFTIEVGPVPQGVLRHDVVEKTQVVLHAALEYLQRYNADPKGLTAELRGMYAGSNGRVPCFRSAKAVRVGEMSGKISWPSFPENENLPMWMVHKDVQDKDFEEIRTGDPLFVDLEGNVIPYDGSHGSPVYLIFVNEGGYYYKTSGTGIAVADRAEYGLEDGMLIEEEEEVVETTTCLDSTTTTVDCV